MSFISWFKKMTFDGAIEKEIGTFPSAKYGGKLQVQKLEKKIRGEDVYRFNTIRTTMASYQSLPILLTKSQLEELKSCLDTELPH